MNKNILEQADCVVTVAVDVQNDFCPDGSLAVPEGNEVIPPLNRVMAYTRKIGGTVIATRDWHPEQTPHFETWPVHCVADTYGAAFHEDLDLKENDIVISKGMGQTDGYSGFEGVTDDGKTIDDYIYPRFHDRVVILIGGLATDYCVKATALRAANIANSNNIHSGTGQIDVYAIEDAMRAVNIQPDDGEKSIQEMRSAGVRIVTSAELIGQEA